MKIQSFVIGMLHNNCYLVIHEETKEAVVIDAAHRPQKMIDYAKEQGLDIKAILLTHGHFDHIMGIDDFLKEYDIPVYVHEAEKDAMNDPTFNLSRDYSFGDAVYVKEGDVLTCAGITFQVIHTPGHTLGGACYYMEAEHVLFSGDTLFEESIGRTDFPNGSTAALVRSIREKLFVLPEDTAVYPGHMGQTSIGHEKLHNPYV